MSTALVELMLECGAVFCDDTLMTVSEDDLVKYTNKILQDKERVIEDLQSALYTARAQNGIYKNALNDGY